MAEVKLWQQLLSGHLGFHSYLHKIWKAISPVCFLVECGIGFGNNFTPKQRAPSSDNHRDTDSAVRCSRAVHYVRVRFVAWKIDIDRLGDQIAVRFLLSPSIGERS